MNPSTLNLLLIAAAGLVALGCTPTQSALADSGLTPAAEALNGLRWKKRVLVITAPAADHEEAKRQEQLMNDATGRATNPGYAEREIDIIRVIGDDARPEVNGRTVRGDDLRRVLDLPADRFGVVLIGKDGGVKRRESKAISSEDLFATIDAMPMRQAEMKR